MAAARFIVSGTVQGVFYRASARTKAVSLGLSGYAKNRTNGDVEVLAVGAGDALDALEKWLRRGPPMAHVESVVRQDAGAHEVPDDAGSGFTIR